MAKYNRAKIIVATIIVMSLIIITVLNYIGISTPRIDLLLPISMMQSSLSLITQIGYYKTGEQKCNRVIICFNVALLGLCIYWIILTFMSM